MRREHLLSEFNNIIDNPSKNSAAVTDFHPRFQWSDWLGWRQWLVFFTMGALVIVIEVRNHARMWQEHSSGQTILTDPELIWEIFLFGLILPVLGGLTLAYMGRTAIERDKIAREQELRRALIGKMHEAQNWHELVEVVVTTPDTIASADRAWLLAQRSGEENFDQIAHWERLGSGLLPSPAPVSPAICEHCLRAVSPKGSRIMACQHADSGSSTFLPARYCLQLSSAENRKVTLLFDMPFDRPLDRHKAKVLDDLGNEMSLAIDNANLHYLEQREFDAARNERLRIARDLHDTLGQSVSYLRLKLEQLSSAGLASDGVRFQNDLADMLTVADEAYEQLRDSLEELRTTERRGLEEAIRLYAVQAAERAGFSVSVHSNGQPGTLSPRQSRQIMYILREALNNVEKHAGAQNVDIYLRWMDGEFGLTMRDNGKGFNLQELNREDGYGIAIMGERSRAILANLNIKSNPGDGTEIILSLPLSSSVPAGSSRQ